MPEDQHHSHERAQEIVEERRREVQPYLDALERDGYQRQELCGHTVIMSKDGTKVTYTLDYGAAIPVEEKNYLLEIEVMTEVGRVYMRSDGRNHELRLPDAIGFLTHDDILPFLKPKIASLLR